MQVSASPHSKTPLRHTNPLLKARNRHFLTADLLLLLLTPFASLWLRLEGLEALAPYFRSTLTYALVALCVRVALFYPFGLYNRYWRSATVEELAQIVRAVGASALMVGFLFFSERAVPFCRSLSAALAAADRQSACPDRGRRSAVWNALYRAGHQRTPDSDSTAGLDCRSGRRRNHDRPRTDVQSATEFAPHRIH